MNKAILLFNVIALFPHSFTQDLIDPVGSFNKLKIITMK